MLEWILQSAGGLLLFCTTGLAAFSLKEIFRLRSDHSALEAKVNAQNDETQRSFSRVERSLATMDEKLDVILQK